MDHHIFVIETCQFCSDHTWNTRHDEAKYDTYFNKIAAMITDRVPQAVVLRNQIPKVYLPYDLYCNLIPDSDEACPVYRQVPRTGSFEVSYKGLLIFSKLTSGYWPNSQVVTDKCVHIVEDDSDNKDLTKYLAGQSPTKSGSTVKSKKKGFNSRSRSPGGGFYQHTQSMRSYEKKKKPKDNSERKPVHQDAPLYSNIVYNEAPSTIEPRKKGNTEPEPKFLSFHNTGAATVFQPNAYQDYSQAPIADRSIESTQEEEKRVESSAVDSQVYFDRQTAVTAFGRDVFQESHGGSKGFQQESFRPAKTTSSVNNGCNVNVETGRPSRQQQNIDDGDQQEEDKFESVNQSDRQSQREEEPVESISLGDQNQQVEIVEQQEEIELQQKLENIQIQENLEVQEYQPKYEEIEKPISEKNIELKSETPFYVVKPDNFSPEPSYEQSFQDQFIQPGPHIRSAQDITALPEFESHSNTVLSRVLTEELWNKYKDVKDKYGFTFQQVILQGVRNPNMEGGVYAGSEDSYFAFSELFEMVMTDMYGLKGVNEQSKLEMDEVEYQDMDEKCQKMIKGITMRIARNIHGYPFLNAISKDERNEIHDKLQKILTENNNGTFESLQEITEGQKHRPENDKFYFDKGDNLLDSAGFNRDWPEGRAVYQNDQKNLAIWINEEDHIKVFYKKKGSEIKAMLQEVPKIVANLEEGLGTKFSFDQKFGYLAADPRNLGAGLRMSIHLELKSLGRDPSGFKQIAESFGLSLLPAKTQNIYQVSTQTTPQKQETETIQDIYDGIHALTQFEISMRPKRINKVPEYIDVQDDGLITEQETQLEPKIIKGVKRVGRDHEERKIEETQDADELGKIMERQEIMIPDDSQSVQSSRFMKENFNQNMDFPLNQDLSSTPHHQPSISLGGSTAQAQKRVQKQNLSVTPQARFQHKQETEKGETIRTIANINNFETIQQDEESKQDSNRIVHKHASSQVSDRTEQAQRDPALKQEPPIQTSEDRFFDQNEVIKEESIEESPTKKDVLLERSRIDPLKQSISTNVFKDYAEFPTVLTDEKEIVPVKKVGIRSQLSSYQDLVAFPDFEGHKTNLLSKYLTSEIWDSLEGKEDKYGFKFEQAIFPACKFPQTEVGVQAGSDDSYRLFGKLFAPIIKDLHFGKEQPEPHVIDTDLNKIQELDISETEKLMITKIEMRLRRNFENYPYSPAQTTEQRHNLESKLIKAFDKLKGTEYEGRYITLHKIIEFIGSQEGHPALDRGLEIHEAAGVNKDWPNSRGIFQNNKGDFFVQVNQWDHIKIAITHNGPDVKNCFKALNEGSVLIEQAIGIQYQTDQKLGYLTASPENLGTAMRISAFLKIPKLQGQKRILDKLCLQQNLYWKLSSIGDTEISTLKTLGTSEVAQVNVLISGLKAILEIESSL